MVDHGKLLTTALRGGKTVRPPIWLMRQAGRYLPEYRAVRAQAGSFLEVCYTPDLTVEVTLQPVRRFGLDAAILFSDILVIPDAMGQEVTFIEGEGPRLEPVTGVDGLGRLSVDRVTGYLTPVYESVRRLRAELPAETALIGFAGAPWTVATYMVEGGGSRDYACTKLWAYGDPDGFARLIDMLVEATTAHLIAQAESGVDAVQLFDSWAGVLPEAAFRRWVIEPTARIIGAFRARCADVPVIGFPRGAGLLTREYAEATGVDAIGLDTTMPLDWARDTLRPNVALQGNLDPVMLVAGGALMRTAAENILHRLGSDGFVFNLGHGILPQTPPEHVAELTALVRGWRP